MTLRPAPECAVASVAGGAVTRERLQHAARAVGRGGSRLIKSLLAQSLPSTEDLARAYGADGGVLRLDASFLQPSSRATRFLDAKLMREHRCVPVEILDDVCVLAVEAGSAARAVRAVRTILQRDVLPVITETSAMQEALHRLGDAPRAVTLGGLRPKDSPVHARFRELVIEAEPLEALPLAGDRA